MMFSGTPSNAASTVPDSKCGEPVVSERNHRDIAAGLQTEMLERGVRHQGRGPARGAAGHLFSLEVARPTNIFSANERLQRPIDGTGQDFGRRTAHDTLNNPVDRRAVIKIATHKSRVHGLSGHKNHFQIDPLVAVKSFVEGEDRKSTRLNS